MLSGLHRRLASWAKLIIKTKKSLSIALGKLSKPPLKLFMSQILVAERRVDTTVGKVIVTKCRL
jgi:hypothetical protein